MKGSAEMVAQEEAIIQVDLLGQGLISSICTAQHTYRKTRDRGFRRYKGEFEQHASRDPSIAMDHHELPKLDPNHEFAHPAALHAETADGGALMLDRLSIGGVPRNLSPVIKVTIERNNSNESRTLLLLLPRSLDCLFLPLNGSSVTRNLRFRLRY
ncbi:hypothetical protein X777_06162 [Ooceraea biroi]|uniref:Uncharacterized protein n=1 Tax=Ooceraea biroi TaxID=2015173 RepID=A0A026WDZ1_OOCBI|nr:hypothetical protein X777_06162 [Ooceraea biroi]